MKFDIYFMKFDYASILQPDLSGNPFFDLALGMEKRLGAEGGEAAQIIFILKV